MTYGIVTAPAEDDNETQQVRRVIRLGETTRLQSDEALHVVRGPGNAGTARNHEPGSRIRPKLNDPAAVGPATVELTNVITGYKDVGASRVPTWSAGAVTRRDGYEHEADYVDDGATRGATEIGD